MNTQNQTPQSFDWQNVKNNMMRLVFSFGVFSLFVGMVAVMLSRQSIETNQDIRNQASVDSGPVKVTSKTSTGKKTFQVGDSVDIDLLVTTNGEETAGIQTVFNIVTDVIGSDITVEPHTQAGLISEVNELEEVDDGFLITNFSRPSLGTSFNTSNKVAFLRVSFTPEKPGPIIFNFDSEKSKSPKYGSNPPEELLKHIKVMEFEVAGDNTDEEEENTTDNVEETSSPEPSTDPTPTPQPVGGSNTTCNIECVSNNDCGTNQRCYDTGSQKRCRLVTNVSSESCQSLPDQGLSRSCNQYCADSNECAEGLSCWYNQCRHEDNIANISCSPPSEEVTRLIQEKCNTHCNSNADCSLNMACLSNQCRLASNLSSATCTARTKHTVSVIYTAPKGGQQTGVVTQQPYQGYQQPPTNQGAQTPPSTPSTTSPTRTSPSPYTNEPTATTSSNSSEENAFGSFIDFDGLSTGSALDAVMMALDEYGAQLGVDAMTLLRLLAIGLVALLIIWWLLALLFGKRKEKKISKSKMNGSTMMPPSGAVPPSLKTNGAVGVTPPKTTFSNPGLTAAPVAPYKPSQPATSSLPGTTQPGKIETTTISDNPQEKKSSMVSKLQAKGVETPK